MSETAERRITEAEAAEHVTAVRECPQSVPMPASCAHCKRAEELGLWESDR